MSTVVSSQREPVALAKPNTSVLSGASPMMRRNTDLKRAERALGGALLVAAALSGGCLTGPLSEGNAANPHLEAKVYPIKCDDGRRYAAKTLKARNYRITDVSRSGAETVVSGRNDSDRVSSSITVDCQGDGVMVRPQGGSQWVVDGLRFGYYQIVQSAEQIWPPPTGPVVQMDLFRGPEAKIEFPTEIEPLGVVAVRVKILNAGERTLTVDPRRVRAVNESGAQALPIVGADAERKLGGADPEINTKLLKATTLRHGESTVGFVFFPVASYSGGSLALVDEKTGEADDYDVNFATLS
jgi:hypothetical protein